MNPFAALLPKQTFLQQWAKMLRDSMSASGRGYRHFSLRKTGKGEDRRNDKMKRDDEGIVTGHIAALPRRYKDRYNSTPMSPSKKAIARRKRGWRPAGKR